ncbi:MAG TPA: DUF5995 family protein [Granulicella sp.]|jgi:hypothetical protein
MFPYDAVLAKATGIAPASIADVLATMQTIETICDNGDGVKWFNWLYMQVTESVENRVAVDILSTIDDPEDAEILRSDLASIEL